MHFCGARVRGKRPTPGLTPFTTATIGGGPGAKPSRAGPGGCTPIERNQTTKLVPSANTNRPKSGARYWD